MSKIAAQKITEFHPKHDENNIDIFVWQQNVIKHMSFWKKKSFILDFHGRYIISGIFSVPAADLADSLELTKVWVYQSRPHVVYQFSPMSVCPIFIGNIKFQECKHHQTRRLRFCCQNPILYEYISSNNIHWSFYSTLPIFLGFLGKFVIKNSSISPSLSRRSYFWKTVVENLLFSPIFR